MFLFWPSQIFLQNAVKASFIQSGVIRPGDIVEGANCHFKLDNLLLFVSASPKPATVFSGFYPGFADSRARVLPRSPAAAASSRQLMNCTC